MSRRHGDLVLMTFDIHNSAMVLTKMKDGNGNYFSETLTSKFEELDLFEKTHWAGLDGRQYEEIGY